MNIQEILNRVPDYQTFLTVEEMDRHSLALAEKYPEVVSVRKIGESQQGHPMYVLKIGEGQENAYIMGCPHPNEPIGAMILEFLTEELATNEELRQELGFTWYILKTADPDGVKLNEGWFQGPFTLYNYARHFYRPASDQQVEWTFPLDYKTLHFHSPLPETAAVMRLLEEIKPRFLFSLHNSAFGGAYWYISEAKPALLNQLPLAAGRQGIPLNLGEPEMPCCTVYSDAIFEFPGMPMMYDFYESMTGQDPVGMLNGGASSVDFAKLQGPCFGLVCEMPYFMYPQAMDMTPTEVSRREAVLKNVEIVQELYRRMKPLAETLCPLLPERDSYRLALEERMAVYEPSLLANQNFALQSPEYEAPATVAQRFDNLYAIPFYHLLGAGMIAKGAEKAKTLHPERAEELDRVVAEADELIRTRCAELEQVTTFEAVAIRRLVSVQLESGLRVAAQLAAERP